MMQVTKPPTAAPVQVPARVRTMTRRLTAKVLTFFSQNEAEQLRILRQRLLEFANTSKDATEAQIGHWHMARQFLDRDATKFTAAYLKALDQGIDEDMQAVVRRAQTKPKAGEKLQAPNSKAVDFLGGLSLVGADEMDRMLLRDRVVQRFNSRYEDALTTLNQRMRALFDSDIANLQGNPYRPDILIHAFSHALQQCGFEDDACQDVLLALDPGHWIDLKPLYAELDSVLLDSGVSSETHRVRKSTGADSGTAWTPADPNAPASPTAHGRSQFGEMASGFAPSGFSEIRSAYPGVVTSAMRSGLAPSAAMAMYDTPRWSAPSQARSFLRGLGAVASPTAVLVGAPASARGHLSGWHALPAATAGGRTSVEPFLVSYLEGLQAEVIESMSMGGLDFNSDGLNVLHELRGDEHFVHAQEMDRGTLDALAEVFDFVFNDAAIPAPLKVIIGRLQIPVLKAAMLDRAFFLSPNHPARKLIDALAAAAPAWSSDDSIDDPLYLQIETSVKRVLNEFDQDLALFSEILLEFEAFLAKAQAQAAAQINRVASEEEVAEALDAARVHVDQALHERVLALAPERSATALLTPFLTRQWREVLARAYLNQAAKPDDWSQLLATTDQLIWSTEHKSDAAERRQLITVLPTLVRQINASLDELGWVGEERETFTKRLIATHMNALRSTIDDAPDSAPNTVDRQTSEEAVKALDERLAQAQEAQDEGTSALLGELTRGMWFEHLTDDEQLVRCRLTWISPKRSRFLFTNRDGFDAFVGTERQVRHWLVQRRLRVLSHPSIVGRALEQILGEAEAEVDIPT